MTRSGLALGLALALAAAGCEDHGAARDDAGPSVRSLEILDPPGDQIGLAFSASATLRVRYRDEHGVPVDGERVGFAIAAENPDESPGGATLSDATAVTDAGGIAAVEVVAGAAAARFRVRASAPLAPAVTFYVAVAAEGRFATLLATPRRVGRRPASDFSGIEVRLYLESACAGLDPAAPPATAYPPRQLDRFDEPVTFLSVAAGRAHALLGTGRGAAGQLLAAGCLELLPAQLGAGVTVLADLPLEDLPAALAAGYAVASTFDLAPLRTAVAARAPAWRLAACPRGAAQLVLDAALAVLGPEDPTAQALSALRSVGDADGCRPEIAPGGGHSADALVQAALAPDASAPAAHLPALAAALADLLDRLHVRSTLAPAQSSVEHRLDTLTLDVGGVSFAQQAEPSTRPIVVAVASLSRGGTGIGIGEHGFTLRLGWLAEAAFDELALAPAGLGGRGRELGAALQAAAVSGGRTGCDAVSAAACAGAGLPATCLAAACRDSAAALDAQLARPFAVLQAPSIDLTLRGAATAVDADDDLAVEALAGGIWSASVPLSDGTAVSVSGAFASEP